jgi:hypothetical protein
MDGWNSDSQNFPKNKKGTWVRDADRPISLLGGNASSRPTALLICNRCTWYGTGACERCDPYTGARMV